MSNGNGTSQSVPSREFHCGARARFFDNRRCTLKARHDGWHVNADKNGSVRWNNDGSYEIEIPTKRTAA